MWIIDRCRIYETFKMYMTGSAKHFLSFDLICLKLYVKNYIL